MARALPAVPAGRGGLLMGDGGIGGDGGVGWHPVAMAEPAVTAERRGVSAIGGNGGDGGAVRRLGRLRR